MQKVGVRLFGNEPGSRANELRGRVGICGFLSKLKVRCREASRRPTSAVRTYGGVSTILNALVYGGLFLYGERGASFCLLVVPNGGPFGAGSVATPLNYSHLSFTSPRCVRGFLGVSPNTISVVKLVGSARGGIHLIISETIFRDSALNYRPYIGASDLGFGAGSVIRGCLPTIRRRPAIVRLP